MNKLFLLPMICITACATNPNHAVKLDTQMKTQEAMTPETSIGVKNGDMIFQRKVSMTEELRRLQNEVYSLEDRVYGNRKFGSLGLYGNLRECRKNISIRGNGKLIYTEPLDRITDKEEDFKVGLDDRDKIIGLSEEFLLERIDRFKNYKRTLEKRQDEYEEKIEICDTELKSKQVGQNE